MAYMNQERKAAIAPVVKAICKKYGVKASLAVRHHSTLVLNIKSGKIDFIESYRQSRGESQMVKERPLTYIDVNPYWHQEHFTGTALSFMKEVFAALKGPDYFDHSDIQTDYFNCSHYVDVNIGQWDKPYNLTA